MSKENAPEYIQEALEKGFDVEVDVWYEKGKWSLGHDNPQHEVNISFLKDERLWCHAKNIDALEEMLRNDIHCFWHQADNYTLTSRGHIWTYPGNIGTSNSVIVCRTVSEIEQYAFTNVLGICADYLLDARELMR